MSSSLPICNFKAMLHRICNILNHSSSCLHVNTRSISYVRFDWSFIFRVRIAKNVLICKPDPKNNKYKIWFNIFRSQKSYFSFFIHLLQNYLQINILCNPDPKIKRPIKSHVDQTLVEWSVGDPLPKLCPAVPTSNQHGRCY